jgi:SAM-dependent methyltransferase
LPRASFDLVYCRFLLRHLPDPMSCLREMWSVLKPDGIVVVEDGDLATATSIPPTALDAFADLFCRLGPIRGVDYSLAQRLYHMVRRGVPRSAPRDPSTRLQLAPGHARLLEAMTRAFMAIVHDGAAPEQAVAVLRGG